MSSILKVSKFTLRPAFSSSSVPQVIKIPNYPKFTFSFKSQLVLQDLQENWFSAILIFIIFFALPFIFYFTYLIFQAKSHNHQNLYDVISSEKKNLSTSTSKKLKKSEILLRQQKSSLSTLTFDIPPKNYYPPEKHPILPPVHDLDNICDQVRLNRGSLKIKPDVYQLNESENLQNHDLPNNFRTDSEINSPLRQKSFTNMSQAEKVNLSLLSRKPPLYQQPARVSTPISQAPCLSPVPPNHLPDNTIPPRSSPIFNNFSSAQYEILGETITDQKIRPKPRKIYQQYDLQEYFHHFIDTPPVTPRNPTGYHEVAQEVRNQNFKLLESRI